MRRFRPYFRYLRPLRAKLALALVALCLYSAANGFGLPYLLPTVFGPIFDSEERTMALGEVARLALLIPALFLVRGAAGYLSAYLFQGIGTRVLEALRVDYFSKLQHLPLAYLQRYQKGDLSSRAISDANQLQYTITALASEGVKHPLSLVGALSYVIWAALTTEGIALALVCMAIVPLCVFPVRYVGRKVLKRAQQAQSQIGSISSLLTENLGAAREVRAFGLEALATTRFAKASRALLTAQMKIVKYALALNPTIEVLSALGIALTLVFAYRTGISFSSLMGVLTALYLCYEPVKKLGALNSELKRGAAALDRLEPILREPLRITDPENPRTLAATPRGEIAFEHVSFSYAPDAPRPVLDRIDIKIPAGTTCALVGPSGGGKTTFVNLILRLHDIDSGAITIDGTDIRQLRLAELRRHIAIVSQEPVLFNDTIYNNLLLGRPDATREEVIAAATAAHADEFIRNLPKGYDTNVGEHGALVSGGQKQRIAIARAFLRNAPILILDEATSALDAQSEQMIQDALQRLVVGKTVLIIAHRFSTIRDASMILVLDQGRLVASGPHAELYANTPLYRSLYDQQTTSPHAAADNRGTITA
ncbi:ABC transporter [Cephaloticoccus primus]|uniref:ABC transporter n=1 Tax=Cephaloticoccus primus TaxID=1548207 RepID=A0A139SMU0_9BACT|nr:ABC transporter ATP-binding protein [Cephaloticoccus primus]KXU35907.1 ABC transporter [Cephaloticoccus primus]